MFITRANGGESICDMKQKAHFIIDGKIVGTIKNISTSFDMDNDMIKEKILGTVSDLVANFMYYDRNEDFDLDLGDIENAIHNKVITIDEIVDKFRKGIEAAYFDDGRES